MKSPFLWILLAIASVFFAPWWVFVAVLFGIVFYARMYWSAVFFSVVADLILGLPGGFGAWYTLVSILFIVFSIILRPYIRGFDYEFS